MKHWVKQSIEVAAHHYLPNTAHRFGPGKALLDEFSLLLRDGVAVCPRNCLRYRRAPAGGVLRHMRRDIDYQARLDELLGVVALVRTQRDGR